MKTVTLLTTREMYSSYNSTPAALEPYVISDEIDLSKRATFYDVLSTMTKQQGDISDRIKEMISGNRIKTPRKVRPKYRPNKAAVPGMADWSAAWNRNGSTLATASSAVAHSLVTIERLTMSFGYTSYPKPVMAIECYQEIDGHDIAIPSRISGFPYATLREQIQGFLTEVNGVPCLDMVVSLLQPAKAF